ncbi:MAG: hypothetical protein ACK4YM_02935 [Novosphingobium sp.]
MVDYFALALSHGLLVLAGWKLLARQDLDADPAPPKQGQEPHEPPARRPKPELRLRA